MAVDLGKRGWKVALVERSEKMYGGTCINVGCIPTKTLVYRAKLAMSRNFGSMQQRRDYYRESVAVKEEVVAELRELNYRNLADAPRVTVYTGEASLASGSEVSVRRSDGGTETISSQRIFINTGAAPFMPPIPGADISRRVYTSASIMDLAELPQRLVIIGGGYIGLEFASIYASFGSKVTVIEGMPRLLPRQDRDIAAAVEESLRKKGVEFHLNAMVGSVEDREYDTVIHYTGPGGDRETAADAVLVAAGRRPYTEGLNLEAAGVDTDGRGNIIVDDRLRTSNPCIWALGDVKGGPQFTYISLDDYRIVKADLFGGPERRVSDRDPVSYSVFIDPPLSGIGMGEDEARQAGRNVRINKISVGEIPRMKIIGGSEGVMKAVIDADTDEILGCTLFCPHSCEVINTVALAMKAGIKAAVLRDFIYTHPSMSESFNELFA